jgi:hypothetical protein
MPEMDKIYRFSVDPTVNDDSTANYEVGDEWLNDVSGDLFELLDNTAGAAVWQNKTEALSGSYTVVAGPTEYTPDSVLAAPTIVNVSILVLDATSNVSISGLERPSPAKTMEVILFNNSATSNITLLNNNAGSTAENRFLSNGNVTINEKEAVRVFYSTSELRWIPVTT